MGINCTYSLRSDLTPILQNYSLTSSGLKLTVSNYQYFPIFLNTTTVSFANSPCIVSSISLPTIQCTLPKTPNNTFQLEAGSYKPLVHISNIGYALYSSNLQAYFVPLQINSLSSNQGSSQGGHIIQINGNGFPYVSARQSLLTVLIGETSAQIIQSTNLAILVKTPPIQTNGGSKIEVSLNSITAQSNAYTYNDSSIPIISSIAPASASPALKTIIFVQGSNFGTDMTKIRLFLDPISVNGNTYNLSVINATSNQIYGVLGGGNIGSYRLKVEISGIGASKEASTDASLFNYELIIYSITPNSGGVYGGTNITITGKNLSPVLKQNQVYLGDNNYCVILQSSSSSLVCQTNPAPTDYINTQLPIVMTQRVQDEAVCQAKNCNFFFDNTTSPIINTSNLAFLVARAGEIVRLNGSNLYPDLNNKVIVTFLKGSRIDKNLIFDMNLQIEATEVNTNYVKFKMPSLIQASYSIQVYVGNNGWAYIDPNFTIVTPIEVYNIIVNNGNLDNKQNLISKGGAIITISGNGFSDENVFISNGIWWCPIYTNSTTQIVCMTGSIWTENKYQVYVYRDGNNMFTCPNCTFNVTNNKTLSIWSSSCDGITQSPTFTCVLGGDNLNLSYSPVPYLLTYWSDNTHLRYMIPGQALSVFKNNVTVTFSNIPNGTYYLSAYYQPQGFAVGYKVINVGLFNISSTTVASSYFGGKTFSISGAIFPDMTISNINNVTICGSVCILSNFTPNSINCIVPKLVNPQILDLYQIRDQEADFQTDFDVYADDSWYKQFINDDKVTTTYYSQNNFCNISFDFREDYLFEAQEIHYYPFTGYSISQFYGLLLQASYDGINWDTLYTLDKNMKTGWNIWTGNSPSYRFFMFQSPIAQHPSFCRLAEVKFYGIKYYGKANTLEMGCRPVLNINGYSLTLQSLVIYSQNSTAVVTDISPNTGPTSGGSTVSIVGNGFGYVVNNVQVFIDDITCIVRIVTDQKIICVTGAKYQ